MISLLIPFISMAKKIQNDLTDFDFGFSTLDTDPLETSATNNSLKDELQQKSQEIEELTNRLNLLYNSVVPFLDNLCRDPEKTTIHWPNRVEKITEYKQKLKSIVEGK